MKTAHQLTLPEPQTTDEALRPVEHHVESQIDSIKAALPLRLQEAVASVEVREAVAALKNGSWVVKWRRRPLLGTLRRRVFLRVDMEALRIVWAQDRTNISRSKCLYLKSVDLILPGLAGKKQWKKLSDNEKELGFELVSRRRVDRFVCESVSDWRLWMRGLIYAHHKSRVKRASLIGGSQEQTILRALWKQADVDNSESIQFHECVPLLQSLDYHADIHYVSYVFYHSIKDASHVLEYDEFETVMLALLTHDVAKEEFLRFCAGGQETPFMTLAEFSRFLDSVQLALSSEVQATMRYIKSLQVPYSTTGATSLPKALQQRLTLFGFCRYLTCLGNNAFATDKLAQYQPMSRPLQSYWIRTVSHWALPNDTIKTAASRLIALLQNGVRGIVIPCCATEEGDIMVNIGQCAPSVSPGLVVRDILSAVADHAFSSGNQYPVILWLVVKNLNAESESALATLTRQALGTRLWNPSPEFLKTKANTESSVCSPETLRNAFVAICAGLPNAAQTLPYASQDAALIQTKFSNDTKNFTKRTSLEDRVVEQHIVSPSRAQPQIPTLKSPPWLLSYFVDLIDAQHTKSVPDVGVWNAADAENLHQNPHVVNLLYEAEKKNSLFSLIFSEENELVCNAKNPIPAWHYGFQMVESFYGVFGLATLLDSSRFEENGNCGYVLKPSLSSTTNSFYTRSPSLWKEAPLGFTLTVLAAQQLPRPSTERRHLLGTEDTLSPYIIVSICGVPGDCCVHQTTLVSGNGLNPSWRRENFTFTVVAPSVAFLVFEVRSFHPSRTVTVAYAAIPVSCLRPGLRWVPLRNILMQLVPWSGILVRIRMRTVHPTTS